MIVFDLRCASGHVFEAWFASGAAYDQQREHGQVACPLCDDTAIDKAAMAPSVPAKGNSASSPSPHAMKAALAVLAEAQSKALAGSQWVGDAFAARARAMHEGEEARTVIHGQATLADAKALLTDGITVTPLLLPVVPPDKRH